MKLKEYFWMKKNTVDSDNLNNSKLEFILFHLYVLLHNNTTI